MAKVKELILKFGKHFIRTVELLVIAGITFLILSGKTPEIFQKTEQPLRVITHQELDVWYGLDGKIILVDKKSGGTKILSDSLATDIMLTKLKFYYTEELRRAGKLSEVDNIDSFFHKKP